MADVELKVGGTQADSGIENGEVKLDMTDRDPEEINSHLKVCLHIL